MTDTLRIKRRPAGGAAGAPASLAAAEIAFNEQDNTLYYGKGNSAGAATSIIPIAGTGAFLPLSGGTLTGALIQTAQTNPLYIYNSGMAGAGTLPPFTADTIIAAATVGAGNTAISLYSYGAAPIYRGWATGGGNPSAPVAVGLNRNLVGISGGGFNGSVWAGGAGQVFANASQNWTSTAQGARINFNTTTNNTTTSNTKLRLDHDGALLVDPTGTFTNDGVSALQVTGAATLSGALTIHSTLQVDTWVSVGTSTTNSYIAVNGQSSGNSSGPAYDLYWGGTKRGSVAGYSQLYGGAYDSRVVVAGYDGLVFSTLWTNRFTIDSSGNSAFAGTLGVTGKTSLSAGLSFGTRLVDSTGPTDLTQHIALYDGWGGFSVTSGALNVVAAGTLQTVFSGSSAQMQVPLYQAADPVSAMGTATKQYTDTKLALAGGTLTGQLNIANGQQLNFLGADGGPGIRWAIQSDNNWVWYGSNASGSDRVVAAMYVRNDTSAFTFAVPMTMQSSVTLAADPTAAMHAATKQYVDNRITMQFANVAALRAFNGTPTGVAIVQGFATVGDGGEGNWVYVSSDTTSADNSGTVIVDAASHRWHRVGIVAATFDVMWFGAKGDGTTNDAPAIQAAINALGPHGGVVTFPPKTFAVGATLNLGNGSASAISTVAGIVLRGTGGPSPKVMFWSQYTLVSGTLLKWTGAANGTMISILGPVDGCAVQSMYLDGNTSAGKGISVISGSFGEFKNLALRAFTVQAVASNTVDLSGAPNTDSSSLFNSWQNISVAVPAVANAIAFVLTGSGTGQSDTDFNSFTNIMISLPTSVVAYGFYLQLADTNAFTNVLVASGGASSRIFMFDYSVNNAFPAANSFWGIDTGGFGTQWINSGTPASGGKGQNYVVGLNQANGATDPIGVAYLAPSLPKHGGETSSLGLTAAVGLTTLFTPAIAGIYRINYYLVLTTAATSGFIQPVFVASDGSVNNVLLGTAINLSGAAIGTTSQGAVVTQVAANTAVSYQVNFSSVVGSPRYNLFVAVEKVG